MKTAAHQYEDKLLELAYGELPAHEASAVEAHVRTCARCSEALSEIRAVRTTMGQLPMVPVPDTGLESLFAYADQAARRNAAGPLPAPTWWRRFMAPILAAGALSLIAVVAVKTSKDAQSEAPTRADVAMKVQEEQTVQQQKALEAAAPAAARAEEEAPLAAAQPAATPAPAADPTMPPGSARGGDVWAAKEGAKAEESEKDEKKIARLTDAPTEKLAEKNKQGDDYERAASRTKTAPPALAKKPAPEKPADDLFRGLAKAKAADSKAGKKAREAKPDSDAFPQNFDQRQAGTGSSSGAVSGGAQIATNDKTGKDPAKVDAAKGELGLSGGSQVRAPPQAEPAPASPPPQLAQQQAAPVAPPYRTDNSSMGLSVGNTSSQNQNLGPSQRNTRDEGGRYQAPPAVAPKPSTNLDDLDRSRKDMVVGLEKKLAEADGQRRAGDTKTEIAINMDVLKAGAKGEQRLRALNGVCRGFEALGEFDKAAPYCQLMMREFPNSAPARAYLDNQNRARPAAKRAAPSKLNRNYEDELQKESPAAPPEPAKATSAQ